MEGEGTPEDEARQSRVDALVAEMESAIAEARETSARMTNMFRELGIEDETALAEIVRSDRCSPELRAMIDDDLARLDREIKDGEAEMLAASGRNQVRKPRRRPRRMTRI